MVFAQRNQANPQVYEFVPQLKTFDEKVQCGVGVIGCSRLIAPSRLWFGLQGEIGSNDSETDPLDDELPQRPGNTVQGRARTDR